MTDEKGKQNEIEKRDELERKEGMSGGMRDGMIGEVRGGIQMTTGGTRGEMIQTRMIGERAARGGTDQTKTRGRGRGEIPGILRMLLPTIGTVGI